MAIGDAKLFRDVGLESGEGDYNFTTDTIKFALLSDTYASISVDTTNPVLTTFTEVSAGGNYAAGGLTVSGVTWTRTAGVSKLSHSAVSMLKDASNPANARTALLYDVTAASSALVAVDLTTDGSTPADLVNNDLTINVNASGAITATVA